MTARAVRSNADAAAIDLSREADFALGTLRVRPSLGQVAAPDGGVERLEPRVMQGLVALSRVEGAVVSRDALIASCWGGVVVGEDAITRVIGKLRRLSERDGAGFHIETLPRIGYRLVRDAIGIEVLPARPAAGAGDEGGPPRSRCCHSRVGRAWSRTKRLPRV